MTRFENGPAKGRTLMLKRAPRFLRVVEQAGNFDALDQLDDEPRPKETISAYEINGLPGRIHLNRGSKGSGWYTTADYQLVPVQPTDAEMRTAASWHNWCLLQQEKRPL